MRKTTWIVIAIWAVLANAKANADDDSLVVHEWGTFTSLQDEQGIELSGINTDDEPVPGFVHNLNPYLFSQPVLSSLHWRYRQKAAPRVHPRVTMRLETPVVYFYPPKSWQLPRAIDVSVEFRGGWLTEFYPKAQPQAPGLKDGQFDFGELTPDTTSSLAWNGLAVGTKREGPMTDERVWLIPREVDAVAVTAGKESERYLFYRGVGRVRAPLRAGLDRQSGRLVLRGNLDEILTSRESIRLGPVWVVQVRRDGQLAYRALEQFVASGDTSLPLAETMYRFEDGDFRPENRTALEAAMHAELVAEGLFAKEATAMLATWKRSYFTSPGLRLFYVVPRRWTDHYLPLRISSPVQIERVMIGRLELISDEQRALLDRLAQVAKSNGRWADEIPESPAKEIFLAGRSDFGDLGVTIPPDFQIYLDLGRFRNALVAHEEHVRPTESLTQFVDTYQLHPFRLPKE